MCSSDLTPDYTYTLNYDEDGHVTDTALDLSCVLESNKNACERHLTINNQVRDCELTGCDGVSVNERTKVALTHCDGGCDPDPTGFPVTLWLKNNGEPVTQNEFGNPVPVSYLVGPGQLKWLCIVNGRIVGIVN